MRWKTPKETAPPAVHAGAAVDTAPFLLLGYAAFFTPSVKLTARCR
jgi:hypothetical protein